MKPLDKFLLWLLLLLGTSQAVQYQGCEVPFIPLPIPPVPVAENLHVVIVRETGDSTPALGSLFVQLRNTDLGKHKLDILDDEGVPPSIKSVIGTTFTVPSLFIIDPATHKLLASRPIAVGETVPTVMATVKEHSNAN